MHTTPPSRSVLVTGCSRGGIGSSLALAFVEKGYTVFATARNPDKIDPKLTQSSSSRVHILTLDVTDATQIRSAVSYVAQRTDNAGLDLLVNNAGVNLTSPLLDLDLVDGQNLFDANFWGPLRAIQAFSPLLVQARGTVINISSIAGVLHTPWMGIYSASKAAITSLSETLRLEMEPLGVRVVTVMAGNVKTSFWDDKGDGAGFALPKGSLYSPVEPQIAAAAKGELSGKQCDADEFAAEIVSCYVRQSAKRASRGPVWVGALAGTVKWVTWLMPSSLLNHALSAGRGLREIGEYYVNKGKDKPT